MDLNKRVAALFCTKTFTLRFTLKKKKLKSDKNKDKIWFWTKGLQRYFTQKPSRKNRPTRENLLGGERGLTQAPCVPDTRCGSGNRESGAADVLALTTPIQYCTSVCAMMDRARGACVRAVCTLSRTSGVVAPSRSVQPRQEQYVLALIKYIVCLIKPVSFTKGHLRTLREVLGLRPPPPSPRRPCWIDLPWWPLIFPLVFNRKL